MAAVDGVVSGIVSSSDSVKSITLASLSLALHAAVAAVAVVVAVALAGAFDRGVSTSHAHTNWRLVTI